MRQVLSDAALETLRCALRDVNGHMTSYSGSCMHGQQCLGIVAANQGQLFGAILDHLNHQIRAGDGTSHWVQTREFELFFRACRVDSLGTQVVIYNPGTAVPEGVTEDVA